MKKLTFEQVKNFAHGVVNMEEKDGKLSFFRFSPKQYEVYKETTDDFYRKSFATAGVTLEFDTDSENMGLGFSVCKGSSRDFFVHSIFVNEERIGELSGRLEEQEDCAQFYRTFQLGKGMKRVRILFPWSVASSLLTLELDEDASTYAVEKRNKILMFGDSITQGYDAYKPENSYASQMARCFDAEVRNKGIAGEQFFSKLVSEKEAFEPDFITVAYGTNDWAHAKKEKFEKECSAFFYNLRCAYPGVPIYAITPIWRADIYEKKEMGKPLSHVAEFIRKVADELLNITVIEGLDLVPHNLKYFQADGLHPIDDGFLYYGQRVCELIKNTSKK